MVVSSGISVVIAGAVALKGSFVKASVPRSVVAPMSVTESPTWFTAGVFVTWMIACAAGPVIPVVAGIDGMVHVIKPFAGLQLGEVEILLLIVPVHVVPDCKYAVSVMFDMSVE